MVVGGTSGMGLGVAQAVMDAGASVVVAGRRPLADRRALDAPEGRLGHALVDVTDEASVRALFDDLGVLDQVTVTASPPPGSWGRHPSRRTSCSLVDPSAAGTPTLGWLRLGLDPSCLDVLAPLRLHHQRLVHSTDCTRPLV